MSSPLSGAGYRVSNCHPSTSSPICLPPGSPLWAIDVAEQQKRNSRHSPGGVRTQPPPPFRQRRDRKILCLFKKKKKSPATCVRSSSKPQFIFIDFRPALSLSLMHTKRWKAHRSSLASPQINTLATYSQYFINFFGKELNLKYRYLNLSKELNFKYS